MLAPGRDARTIGGRRAIRRSTDAADAALASLTIIEAANAEEEALAVAVALREALEDDGQAAALVTPDRALARRVRGGA